MGVTKPLFTSKKGLKTNAENYHKHLRKSHFLPSMKYTREKIECLSEMTRCHIWVILFKNFWRKPYRSKNINGPWNYQTKLVWKECTKDIKEIQKAMKEVRKAMKEIRKAMKEIRKAMKEVQKAMKEIRKAMKEVPGRLLAVKECDGSSTKFNLDKHFLIFYFHLCYGFCCIDVFSCFSLRKHFLF